MSEDFIKQMSSVLNIGKRESQKERKTVVYNNQPI